MNAETIKAIAPVAEKIGQGAQFGWEVVMQQQIVVAWVGVFWVLFGIALAVATWLSLTKIDWDWDYDPALSFIGSVGTAVSIGAILCGSITAITHFLNPSYYALDFFIHLAK